MPCLRGSTQTRIFIPEVQGWSRMSPLQAVGARVGQFVPGFNYPLKPAMPCLGLECETPLPAASIYWESLLGLPSI